MLQYPDKTISILLTYSSPLWVTRDDEEDSFTLSIKVQWELESLTMSINTFLSSAQVYETF